MGLLSFEWIHGQRRAVNSAPLLAVENVSVRLGQRLVLDNVSFETYEGERVRITGPNGAGKSTLLNAIMGVVSVTAGRIVFRGEDLEALATHERARRGIRYMRQRDSVCPSLSVGENLRLAIGSDGYERFRERFPEWAGSIAPDIPAGMLSGGQKQKLAWGMTVLGEASCFLFDEPSSGVAHKSELGISEVHTALFVEHT